MTEKIEINYMGKISSIRGVFESDHIYKQLKNKKTFYEIKLLDEIKKLNLGGVYVDVGSNIGNHTIFFSEHCNSDKVISFEIDKVISDTLKKNIKENNLEEKVELYNIGLGEKNKKVKLTNINNENVGMTKVLDESGEIEITTIDDLLINEKNISLIKIDVEGYETNVIEGGLKTIIKNSPVIISELKDDFEFKRFESVMKKLDYETDKISFASTPTYFWKRKQNYDLCLVITTYNRSKMLLSLLNNIKNQTKNLKTKIFVLDDGSSEIYSLEDFDVTRINFYPNRGKKNFWYIIDTSFKLVKNINSNYYIYLQDDLKILDNFFEKIIEFYNKINDPKKISLEFRTDDRVKGPHWNNFLPVDYGDFIKTQWVELDFICEKKFFETLEYRIDPVPKTRWDKNPRLGSGVGQQLTDRINMKKLNMYHLKKSLVFHGEHDSLMNYEERKLIKLKTN